MVKVRTQIQIITSEELAAFPFSIPMQPNNKSYEHGTKIPAILCVFVCVCVQNLPILLDHLHDVK